jgi:hypothetical protein
MSVRGDERTFVRAAVPEGEAAFVGRAECKVDAGYSDRMGLMSWGGLGSMPCRRIAGISGGEEKSR